MTMHLSYLSPDLSSKQHSFDLKSQTSTEGDQNELHGQFCANSLIRSSPPCSKAKTSLCKNFTEKGFCSYGKKCQFAHGPEELRVNMEHNRSYKTKTCHAFTKKGFCHFGERCNFIHQQSMQPLSEEQWRQIYSNHRQTLAPPELRSRSRLLSLLEE